MKTYTESGKSLRALFPQRVVLVAEEDLGLRPRRFLRPQDDPRLFVDVFVEEFRIGGDGQLPFDRLPFRVAPSSADRPAVWNGKIGDNSKKMVKIRHIFNRIRKKFVATQGKTFGYGKRILQIFLTTHQSSHFSWAYLQRENFAIYFGEVRNKFNKNPLFRENPSFLSRTSRTSIFHGYYLL